MSGRGLFTAKKKVKLRQLRLREDDMFRLKEWSNNIVFVVYDPKAVYDWYYGCSVIKGYLTGGIYPHNRSWFADDNIMDGEFEWIKTHYVIYVNDEIVANFIEPLRAYHWSDRLPGWIYFFVRPFLKGPKR